MQKILLITPPLTQLNTPYPATAYLKGFLKSIDYNIFQADLGIELILKVFSKEGLIKVFLESERYTQNFTSSQKRMFRLKDSYIATVDSVIKFLQGKDSTLSNRICFGDFLPEGARFENLEEVDWAFGNLGITDKAKYFATLYLEDLADFIRETISPFFEFSRYAEKIALSATSFEPLETALNSKINLIDKFLISLLKSKIAESKPTVIGFSVPFPGNLYGALVCAKFVKENYPEIKTVFGGGYANTELREISEPKFFNYFDFLTLDDGERPFQNLLEFLENKRPKTMLKRTFCLENSEVKFYDGSLDSEVAHSEIGTPDYSNLQLDSYISIFEILNPMHRLWSDGRWNKLTISHGCYWKKCSFCDVNLDYIGRYENTTSKILVDRIESLVENTGQTGFHFVDEAASPNALKELALEILKRNISISWWTNIRFEKAFSKDLCKLLAASGCIAVSGGLEVASDRLLKLIEKGVTVEQVANVTAAFTEARIMVHAYLMYGFPTQTEQETIDSLERVRQLFEAGIVHSAYWHRFSLTAHSPIGKNPEKYQVKITGPKKGKFAWNDLTHNDPNGCSHEKFSQGLSKALYNFMNGLGFEENLQTWFEFKIPKPKVNLNLIENSISSAESQPNHNKLLIVWLGSLPEIEFYTVKNSKRTFEKGKLTFAQNTTTFELKFSKEVSIWLYELLKKIQPSSANKIYFKVLKDTFPSTTNFVFDNFLESDSWFTLKSNGLLLI
ncbi:MAG: radical SAM protein [Calditrichaeota bacterium]|nr:MAG: radical SAM protein [Calditrichota bacterium]